MRTRAVALLLCLACASPKSAPQVEHLPAKLVVVGINDTHGALLPARPPRALLPHTRDDVGGAAWFAGYLGAVREDARAHGGAVVVLDGGDAFQGTLISNEFRGRSVVEAYNALGLTAEAIGNHDFDFGLPALRDRMRESAFPWLSCNIFFKGTQKRPDWAKPSVLIDVEGLKVGIVGVSTRETAQVTNPLNVKDFEFREAGPLVAEEAAKLRQKGATVVLVTAHAGPLPHDPEIQRIARAAAGQVDAIVSGHHHVAIGARAGEGPLVVAGIPIVQSGMRLQSFSTIELTLDDAGRVKGFAVNDRAFPKPGAPHAILHTRDGAKASWRGRPVAPDPVVERIVAGYDAKVTRLRETVVGATTARLAKRMDGKDDLLSNLVVDALRSGAGGGLPADFALQNTGGIRVSELPKGPITFGQLFDLVPFDNEQVVLTLRADELRDALETLVRHGKTPLRVSGLRYVIDWHALSPGKSGPPPGAVVVRMTRDDGAMLCETRTCSATACDAPCAPGAFAVSLTDFLANGGDGLERLKDAPRRGASVLGRDMLVAYVKAHQPLTPELLGAGAEPRISHKGHVPRAQEE